VIVKWLMILAATLLVGALGLRLLVWLPAMRASGRTEVAPGSPFDRAVTRRLVLLAGAALPLLLLTTIAGLLLQLAKVTGRSVFAAFSGGSLGDFLFETREGNIWSARLLLPIVALMLLGPVLVAAWRGEGRGQSDAADDEESAAPVVPIFFGLALGVAYLLTISLISHAAANPFWVPFTVAMDWLHLLGTAVWIGGLGGLVLTVPLVRRLGPALRPVLAQVVSRFSNVALSSVGVLAVTGLYSAWLHVGSLDALLPTTYGRTLLVKLVLFAGLVVLGAFNFLWLRPRLAAPLPKGGAKKQAAIAEYERTGSTLLTHFGRAIRFEVALGVAVLLAVAILTANAPAREALAQARLPKRSQTVTAGDLKLTMSLSSLQPGNTTFDVLITKAKGGQPVTDANRVILRVNHAEMDMGESEATLTSQGNGHYAATESYLSMSGKWDVRTIIQRTNVADVDHTFVARRPTSPRRRRISSPRRSCRN
jgi:putative copper export protein